jgi:hypothetical protein
MSQCPPGTKIIKKKKKKKFKKKKHLQKKKKKKKKQPRSRSASVFPWRERCRRGISFSSWNLSCMECWWQPQLTNH